MDRSQAEAASTDRSTSHRAPSAPNLSGRGSNKVLVGIIVWIVLYLFLYAVSPLLAVLALILAGFVWLIMEGIKAGPRDLSRRDATFLLGTYYLLNEQNERMREQRERQQQHWESLQRRRSH